MKPGCGAPFSVARAVRIGLSIWSGEAGPAHGVTQTTAPPDSSQRAQSGSSVRSMASR
jgi:hypothetical protein